MTYYYSPNTERWRLSPGGDPRGYRPPKGWTAVAHLVDVNPVTGKKLRQSQWWILETYKGVQK